MPGCKQRPFAAPGRRRGRYRRRALSPTGRWRRRGEGAGRCGAAANDGAPSGSVAADVIRGNSTPRGRARQLSARISGVLPSVRPRAHQADRSLRAGVRRLKTPRAGRVPAKRASRAVRDISL